MTWAGPAEGWAAGVFTCCGAKVALGADSRIGAAQVESPVVLLCVSSHHSDCGPLSIS